MTDNTTKQILDLITDLPQNEAWLVLHAIERKFNLAGTMFCPDDIGSMLGRDLTPEEVQQVTETWFWRKGMGEQMGNAGNELLLDIISELDLKDAEELEWEAEQAARESAN